MDQSAPTNPVTNTPVPVVTEGQHASPILTILLVIVLLVSSATAAFLYVQNQQLQTQLNQLTAMPTPTPEVAMELSPTPEATDSAMSAPPATESMTPAEL